MQRLLISETHVTTFPFSTMTQGEANGFSVEVDFVSFTTTAAALRIRDLGSSFELIAQGKTLTFPFSLDRIAYDNFTFSDGSQFLVGDADIQTFADPTSNLINGTSGADYVSGRGGDDEINGQAGADMIYGNQGADSITGRSGADTVFGGQNGDIVNYAGAGDAVTIYGNLGSDTLTGGDAADVIFGGQDDDRISGNSGTDRINAGLGNDIVYGNAGRDTIYGGDGNDALYGGVGSDLIYGNIGNDTIAYNPSEGPADRDLVYGGQGDDAVRYASATFDLLVYGNLGNDQITLGSGADFAYGGQGDDLIVGSAGGGDYLIGGRGNDSLLSGASNDLVDGGEGNDFLGFQLYENYVAAPQATGRDIVIGGSGDDTISYERSREGVTAFGGEDRDRIFGSGYGGADIIYGNQGDDDINGGGGADVLYGGAGNDTVFAGIPYMVDGAVIVSNATIVGGAGADFLEGALNVGVNSHDTFVFRSGDSGYTRSRAMDRTVSDVLLSFDTNTDRIVTGVAGTSSNFVTGEVGDHSAAQDFAEQAIGAGRTYAFAVVGYDGGRGFLFWDSNGDRLVDFEISLDTATNLTASHIT